MGPMGDSPSFAAAGHVSRRFQAPDTSTTPRLGAILANAPQRGALQRCAAHGVHRDPKLWGRIALVAEFDGQGAVIRLIEDESRFPDAAVTHCASRVVRALRLPQSPGSPLLFAVRVGRLPGDAGR